MMTYIYNKPFYLLTCFSAATLASVYFIEHVLGHDPCVLCLYQRLPWYGLLMLGLLGIRWQKKQGAPSAFIGLIVLLTLIGSAILAGYHTGVEFAFWEGPTTCGGVTGSMSSADLKKALLEAKPIRCNEVSIRIFGGSLAFWNFVLSSLLACVAAGLLLFRNRRHV